MSSIKARDGKKKEQSKGPRKRKGGGQPGNRNAMKHGLYSKIMRNRDVELLEEAQKLSLTESIDHAQKIVLVRIWRALEQEAESDKDGWGGKENLSAGLSGMRAEEFEQTSGPEGAGEKLVQRRPDFDSILDRMMARMQGLAALREKLREGHPLSRTDRIRVRGSVLEQHRSGGLTAIEAGRLLEAQGLEAPAVLALEIKAELAQQETDTSSGISIEELDAICAKAKEHQGEESAWLDERRQWLEDWTSEEGGGDPEDDPG